MKRLTDLNFINSYAQLSDEFYARVDPTPLHKPHLACINYNACDILELNHEEINTPQFLQVFSGEKLLPSMRPLSMVYAGHQFGSYVPRLGDGRAILLGEVNTNNGPWELQLKGAGLTPFSRNGDGRAVLRSTIREYLCGEAMHGLGIASTRSLCIISSEEEVYREQIETGALLVRMAPSHVRFGSFEYYYYQNNHDALQQLADYVITHHFPEISEETQPVLSLLQKVINSTALLMAQWQAVGFVHGVMNTDNMSILGLTLDYGPYGFMDAYQPQFGCNHSDQQGRYNYDQQPGIGLFNLSCLAQALLPILAEQPQQAVELAQDALKQYEPLLLQHYAHLMRHKLGFKANMETDDEISAQIHTLLTKNQVDYTRFFRALSHLQIETTKKQTKAYSRISPIRDRFIDREAYDLWQQRYIKRLQQENSVDSERQHTMSRANPKYILRNYMAEVAIQKATQDQDFSEVNRLLKILQNPFEEQTEFEAYAAEPPDWAQQIELSCSS